VKILYLITKSNWGGAQRNVYDLAVSMKAAGHEVKVAVGGAGILKDRLEAAGIFTHTISNMSRDISVGKDAGSLREIFRIIHNEKPDVLHLHSPKAAGLGALCGRLLRVPKIVMTVHGWTWNESRPIHQRAVIVFFSWITALLCHKVLVISQNEYNQGRRLPGLTKRMMLVHLGITTSALISVDGAKQFIAKAVGMDYLTFSKRTVIGVIAELHRNKGLTYLIDALVSVVAEFPQVLCVIISSGEERENLEVQVREKSLEKHIFFLGYLQDAAQYLKAFSMFVLPSIKEGVPYTILEAGAASLPVVSTTVGGIPDVVRDMYSGILVQPANTGDLAHAISFLLENPKDAREYGIHLKEKVLKEYSLAHMTQKVLEVYSS
jgi:glycosyltransferase involved in cell wall biosynthesis